jgi:hypothetical protein
MSRVEDEREAARLAARQAEARRADEAKTSDRLTADSTFKKLVGKGQQEGALQQAAAGRKESLARSAIEHLFEHEKASASEAEGAQQRGQLKEQHEAGFKGRLGAKAAQERAGQSTRSDGQAAQKTKLASDQGSAEGASGRAADQGHAAGRAQAREVDGRENKARVEERREAGLSSAQPGRAGSKADQAGLKTDADQGGSGQGGGGKDSKDGQPGMPAGFRLNPALQPPVPVAQKKDVAGSERLRKMAAELSQKIVERVRVGTNAAGKAEFQIDLRSEVLSGLTVKVSANNGKIRAVFSGNDRDVLKLIAAQGEALRGALAARGLSLEDFKVEARA